MLLTISLLAVSAAVLSALIGFVRAALRARREKAEFLSGLERKSPNLSTEQLAQAAPAVFRAWTHYEMRLAVDAFPLLRSGLILSGLKVALQEVPPDQRTALVYKLRWVHEHYPGPSVMTCERNRQIGKRHLFPSIRASLSGAGIPKDLLSERASEVEGAFLAANSLEAMRVAATHYTLLLLPGLQGGIDLTIERHLMDNERAECLRRLRYLQELREEIEQRPVESWWRAIEREAHPSDRREL
jgi:hypothetical protein